MEPLEGTWPDRVADRAAQLDRPLRGRPRRLRDRGPRRAGHRLHDPPGHAVRRDVLRGRGRRAAGRRAGRRRAAGGVRGLPGGGPQGDRDRAAVDRPPEDRCRSWACTRPTRSPASRSRCGPPTTCWPTTAPARSWRVPGQDQRDWDFATDVRPADRADGAAARGLRGRGLHRRRPGDQLRQRRGLPGRAGRRRGQGARSSTGWRRKGLGSGTVNFRLRDWLL